MKRIGTSWLLSLVWLGASAAAFAFGQGAQTTQTPPPQPPPGAANGPQPGPAVTAPGSPRTREGAPQQGPPSANAEESMRNFLAIGAPPDPAAVKRGQAIFVPTCGFCHGTNAHGGNSGPDLVRSVLVLHDQGSGKEIGPVIHNGRPDKGMPAFTNFTEAQIKDIAAFLLSLNQAAANRGGYQIQNVVTGDPHAGEAYFSAHCASCHSPTGDLAHIATKYDAVTLQSRFLYPRTERRSRMTASQPADTRGTPTVTVTLPSGETYSGILDHQDDFSVSLTDSSGQHRTVLLDDEKGAKVEVHDPLQGHAELLRQYTNADMHNIVAYLETLK